MDFDNRKAYGDTSITDGLVFSSVSTHAKRNCRHPSQPHRKLRFPDQISFNHIAGMDQRTLEEE